jgi:putative nucleic acid binding protein
MTKRKIIIAGIAIVGVIAAAYIYYQYNRTVQGLNDVPADYSVNATELINEYVSNETVANQKYQNKILAVKGTIKKVEDAGAGGIVVLGDTTDMSSVRCVLDSNTNAMGAGLQRGAVITIKGAITGFNKDETGLLGSDVQLNRCVIAN